MLFHKIRIFYNSLTFSLDTCNKYFTYWFTWKGFRRLSTYPVNEKERKWRWEWVFVLYLWIFTEIIIFYFYNILLPFAIWAFTANVHSTNQSLKYIKAPQKRIIHSLHNTLNAERETETETEFYCPYPRPKHSWVSES